MNTLFIIYYRLDTGGIQTKIIDIINYLEKHGLSVHPILILREKHANDRTKEITNPQATVLYYPDTFWSHVPFFFPIYIIGLTYIYRPLSILAFTFIPAICAIWAKLLYPRGIKVILSEDWSEPDDLSRDLHGNFPLLRRLIFRWFYHKADTICIVNTPISNVLIHTYLIPKSILKRVYNWYSPRAQIIDKRKKKKLYDMIYVGRLEKIKNVPFLLSAVPKLISDFPHFKLCIVGTGTQDRVLKTYVKKFGLTRHVHFAGYSSNPNIYLAQSKMFVLASQSEGVPIAALEGMANKLPILCSNYPAVKDIVRHGFNGYVYRSQREFIKYARLILQNNHKREMLGNNGYTKVTTTYSPKNIETYLQLLGV